MHQDWAKQKPIGKCPANGKNDAFTQPPLVVFYNNSHIVILINLNQPFWSLAFDGFIYLSHLSLISTYPTSVQLLLLLFSAMFRFYTMQTHQDSETAKFCCLVRHYLGSRQVSKRLRLLWDFISHRYLLWSVSFICSYCVIRWSLKPFHISSLGSLIVSIQYLKTCICSSKNQAFVLTF